MSALQNVLAFVIGYANPGFVALLSRRDKLLTELGGIYAVLFAARTLLPLRFTIQAYGLNEVTTEQVAALMSPASLGIEEAKSTVRTYRRNVERLTSLHNAWVSKDGGFSRKTSADGIKAVELLLAAKPKGFKAEAEAWLQAFSLMTVGLPTEFIATEISGSATVEQVVVLKPVTSSDKLDLFLMKQGSRSKAAKVASAKAEKKAVAKKAAKTVAKATADVAKAQDNPEGVDAGVKAAGETKGGVLPSAVVKANTADVGHDVEPTVPGSLVGWNELLGTAKQSLDALLSDASMLPAVKRARLDQLGLLVKEGYALIGRQEEAARVASQPKAAPTTLEVAILEAKPRRGKAKRKPTVYSAEALAEAAADLAAHWGGEVKPLASVKTTVTDATPGDSPADTRRADEAEARVMTKAQAKAKADAEESEALADIQAKAASAKADKAAADADALAATVAANEAAKTAKPKRRTKAEITAAKMAADADRLARLEANTIAFKAMMARGGKANGVAV